MGYHKHVIVVEGNALYASNVTRALEEEGHTVVGYADTIADANGLVFAGGFEVAVIGDLKKSFEPARVAIAIADQDNPLTRVVAHTREPVRYGDLYVRKTGSKRSAKEAARAVTNIPR